MIVDAVIRVRFKTPEENGRLSDIMGEYYACPMIVGSEAFDCRVQLSGQRIELGKAYDVPVKFLSRKNALPNLEVGKNISLWEGKVVADGLVLWAGDLADE